MRVAHSEGANGNGGRSTMEMATSPAMVAEILAQAEAIRRGREEEEQADKEAQISGLVRWGYRNKWLIVVLSGAVTVGGGWVSSFMAAAEARVVKRLGDEAQAEHVKANTSAVDAIRTQAADNGKRIDGLETRVGEGLDMMRTALEIQAETREGKRVLRNKPELKAKADAALAKQPREPDLRGGR